MNTCEVCTVRQGEQVCFCSWPLRSFLCSVCVSAHVTKPTTGLPHRPMPMSHVDIITTKELFDTFIKRTHLCEQVKFELSKRVERVNEWITRFKEICDPTLSKMKSFQVEYGEMLNATYLSISNERDVAIQDIAQLMINPDYQPNSALSTACWQFITEQSESFLPIITMEKVEPSRLMDWFEHYSEYLVAGLLERNVDREDSIVTELRAQLAASEATVQNLLQTQENMKKTHIMEKQQLERQKVMEIEQLRRDIAALTQQQQTERRQFQSEKTEICNSLNRGFSEAATKHLATESMLRETEAKLKTTETTLAAANARLSDTSIKFTSATTNLARLKEQYRSQYWPECWEEKDKCNPFLCLTATFCMPLLGVYQSNYITTGNQCIKYEVIVLPFICCCVGAAINRMRSGLKYGVNASFFVGLFAYACGMCNYCLLNQESKLHSKNSEGVQELKSLVIQV